MNEKKLNTERSKDRPYSNKEWSADFTKASDTSKSRLMGTEGKQIQVNHRLDNKKAIAGLLPLRFPDTHTDGKHFKKALNKRLHDVSVHIKHKFHFFKDISLQQTWSVGYCLNIYVFIEVFAEYYKLFRVASHSYSQSHWPARCDAWWRKLVQTWPKNVDFFPNIFIQKHQFGHKITFGLSVLQYGQVHSAQKKRESTENRFVSMCHS